MGDNGQAGATMNNTTAVLVRTLTSAVAAVDAHRRGDGLAHLQALAAATAASERLTQALKVRRDREVAALAATGRYGYQRIGRAARVSASRAAKIAKDAGVPPRHVREDPDLT